MTTIAANFPTTTPGAKAPAIKVVAAPAAADPGDRLDLSGNTAVRLRRINEGAGCLLVRALGEMIKHPGQTAKGFWGMMAEPFIHPMRGVLRCYDSFRQDGWLSGLMTSSLYLSTAITTASFVAMGVGLLLAPFTGGASLAILPIASQIMVWTGLHDLFVTAGLLAKDEYDAVHATNEEDLERKEEMLADDYLNTFFAWVTLPMTDATTALTVAPQGMLAAARAAVKPAARGMGRMGGRQMGVAAAKQVAGRAVDIGQRGETTQHGAKHLPALP